MDTNETIFTSLKGKCPALEEVFIERGKIIFPSNAEIELKDVDLSKIPEENFNMTPQDFYIYVSNHFYIHNKDAYEKTIEDVLEMFTLLTLSESDQTALQKFAIDFWLRLHLFTTEKCLEKDIDFTTELLRRRSVITASLQSPTPAAQVITNIYNQNLKSSFASNNTPDQSNETSQNEQNTKTKGISLSRNKPGLPPTIEGPDESKLGIAGFTSVILIIALTIAFGIYIASNFFTK